ncbi:S53 family peptidase [Dictyobacter aurantiacus]|uniref:Peptidase S53 domain-containing protein n=1 Tax=Dictyobacter aurantiacus TaxID=1936993 RepID=A0A401ZSD7_9CHLR|nr:S53 family peptidase [Dictyobacter aurantiacus]GCE09704.1 hypothetical protein KDAU_70330 [Dictyobacter aurantiacus]
MKRTLHRITLLTVVAMLMLITSGTTSHVTHTLAAGRRVQQAFQVIPGHVIPVLQHGDFISRTATGNIIHLAVSLKLSNPDNLKSLLEAQYQPHSPFYRAFLTPQQFTNEFGPTPAMVDRVVQFLSSQGFTIDAIAPNNLIVDATGTVGMAERAFNITINNYAYLQRTIYAPANDPSVPADLVDIIQCIAGLNNIPQMHHASVSKRIRPLLGTGGGYTPDELRTAYGVNSLLHAGYNGTGQTIAIFELDGYQPSDVNTYLSTYNLGPPRYSNVFVDGATNTAGNFSSEVALDMEIVSALAPNASQKIYIGPNGYGINDIYNKIVTDNLAKVTSISWGLCELNTGNAELAALDTIFMQGAAQGQAFFAASGDTGAYDCRSSNTTVLNVDSPASDPYVVGVGGTSLITGTGGTYTSESAWGNTSRGYGGGGGISSYFTRPLYQTGTNLTDAHRMVPDVSADADPYTGYSMYCTASTDAYCSGWLTMGGTSAAAPLWAGIAADINQYLAAQSLPGLGNAHTPLYNLYNGTQTYPAFHDVTTGTNLYYPATLNYDLATGIGTPNAWNIARDLAGITPTPTPTPTPQPLPDFTIQQIHAGGVYLGIGQTLTDQIRISSVPTAGPVGLPSLIRMVAVLPVGLKNVTVSGTRWTISSTGATSPVLISAVYVGAYPVAAGTTLPTIRISGTVTGAAGVAITDTAVVQVAGDSRASNNLATDTFVTTALSVPITPLPTPTTILTTPIPLTPQALPTNLPNLRFQLSHNGTTFYAGQRVTSTLTVSNAGNQTFNTGSQILRFTGVIPIGLSNVSISGTNWQMTATSQTSPLLLFATYTGITQLEPGQSLPPVSITGTLTTAGAPSITNTIYLSVDKDSYPQNNFTMDTISILTPHNTD